jgi:hypothetical protein
MYFYIFETGIKQGCCCRNSFIIYSLFGSPCVLLHYTKLYLICVSSHNSKLCLLCVSTCYTKLCLICVSTCFTKLCPLSSQPPVWTTRSTVWCWPTLEKQPLSVIRGNIFLKKVYHTLELVGKCTLPVSHTQCPALYPFPPHTLHYKVKAISKQMVTKIHFIQSYWVQVLGGYFYLDCSLSV